MITEGSIEIEAPAAVVWDVFTDVERWPEWTASIERVVALDGPGIEVGQAVRDQAAAPAQARVGGDRGRARHLVDVAPEAPRTPRRSRRTRSSPGTRPDARAADDRPAGPVGVAVGSAHAPPDKRYLDLEAQASRREASSFAAAMPRRLTNSDAPIC